MNQHHHNSAVNKTKTQGPVSGMGPHNKCYTTGRNSKTSYSYLSPRAPQCLTHTECLVVSGIKKM